MKRRSPTLVTFHAHPDDEAIFTAGLVRAARRAGWRPVLVVATSGEEGAAPPGGGDTGAHRRRETLRSAEMLGYAAVHFLGYRDSGPVTGSPAASEAGAFAAATVDDAAGRLAELIEGATVLTVYDAGGIYGHPDHVQVHRVGTAAARFAGIAAVWEATVDRAVLRRIRAALVASGRLDPLVWPRELLEGLGVEEPGLVALDVGRHLVRKRAALMAHASQVLEAETFMGIPAGAFHRLLGTEWYRKARLAESAMTIGGLSDAQCAAS